MHTVRLEHVGHDQTVADLPFSEFCLAAQRGPAHATVIVYALSGERDLAALASVPGIGRKKAERIALELGDRLDDIPLAPGAEPISSPAADAAKALVALGYPAAGAEAAVRAVADATPDADTALLVRRALTELTRS